MRRDGKSERGRMRRRWRRQGRKRRRKRQRTRRRKWQGTRGEWQSKTRRK